MFQNRAAIADNFDALFGTTMTSRTTQPQDIPIDLIDPSPMQARQEFTNLEELAQAIREQGFTSRIRVRPHPDKPDRYQLVYGERRLRAARMAGITLIPADVAHHTEAELREIGLTENIIREDLNPLDEALAFDEALSARNERGQPLYTVRALAERIGKSAGYVDRRMALLRVPPDVQQLVRERPDTVQSAREIAKLDSDDQRALLIDGLLNGTLSSREVEARVKAALQALPSRREVTPDVQPRVTKVVEDEPDEDDEDDDIRAHAAPEHSADRPVATHGPAPAPALPAGQPSVRTRREIEQRLLDLVPAIRDRVPALDRSDRDAVIAMIVDDVIPALGEVVMELQQNDGEPLA